jgi:hypothetical protein
MSSRFSNVKKGIPQLILPFSVVTEYVPPVISKPKLKSNNQKPEMNIAKIPKQSDIISVTFRI